MNRRTMCFFGLVGLIPTLACGLPLGGEEEETEGEAAATGPSAREQEGAKLRFYVRDCYNAVDSRVASAVDAYDRFLRSSDDLQNVRNGPGTLDPGVDAARCRRAVTSGAAAPPSLPELERAAESYAGALDALLPVLVEARHYYSRGTWRDDDMAGGRALHPRLTSVIAAYRTARAGFSEQLGVVETRRTRERLAELEPDASRRGEFLVERLQWHGRQLIDMDEAMLSALAEEGSIPAELQSTYLSAADALEGEVDELQRYEAAPGERLPRGFSGYQRQAEQVLRGQTRVRRYVRDHRTHDLRAMQRHVDHAVRGFNSAIGAYNNLRFMD